MTWRFVPPHAVRSTQRALLLTTAVFGLGFIFDSVYSPKTFLQYLDAPWSPLWAWGALLTGGALAILAAEIATGPLPPQIEEPHRRWRLWLFVGIGHLVLSGVFMALMVATLAYMINSSEDVSTLIGSLRQPVLYGFMGHLHLIFARRIEVKR